MRTTDVDIFNEAVASTYGRTVSGFPHGRRGFRVHANHCQLESIALTYATHTVPLRLEFSAFDHVAQLFAYRGHAEAISRRENISISENRSFVASPGDIFKLNYARDFDQLVLKIKPTALVSKLEALRGDHLTNQLQFPSKNKQEHNESLRRMLLFDRTPGHNRF
jgi:AraC-binding-like domain